MSEETIKTGRNKSKKEKNNLYNVIPNNMDYSNLEENINIKIKLKEKEEPKTVTLQNINSKDFVAINKQQIDKTPITWISNDILDDPSVSATGKGVYMILKRYYNESWGYARISYKKLGELSQIKHQKTLQKYLIELINRGYIQVLDSDEIFDKQKENDIYKFQVRTLYRQYNYQTKSNNNSFGKNNDFTSTFSSEFDPNGFQAIDDDDIPF